MNAIKSVGRVLGALAVVCLLAVDDIDTEQEGTTMIITREDQNQACQSGPANAAHRKPCGSDRPGNMDPYEWALYNERQSHTLATLSGLPAPEPGVLNLAPYEVQQDPPELTDLMLVINRAAGELQGGGERENRIALQLLTALARFEAAR
jgi:hypothetical protein